ncbi:MAG: proton-conducting transporter membrane subunit [Candidatus Glassbacteria bacterium]
MGLFAGSLFCLLAGGGLALVFGRSRLWSSRFGVTGALLGSLFGLAAALRGLGPGQPWQFRLAWSIPGGSLNFGLDPLSAFFLLTLFLISGLTSIFGSKYLEAHAEHKNPGVSWFYFNVLVASMAVVFTARNALLFLVSWEIMAVSSFFLVTFEHEDPRVREAGFTYLVATHLGTAFLVLFFILLGQQAGSFEFEDMAAAGVGSTGLLFLLALVGFGSKAGIVPFHVWLPEAHPSAPSHVSALMSGVMIKTGIYGLLRAIVFLGPPPPWWGWCLVGIGLSSGILGVLFALAQHDLKRLLAYHSVENIGIIFLGLGLGLLGWQAGAMPLAVAGFAGALFHVLNHAVFKGLLFLDAGVVLQAVGRRNLDSLGGLYRRMPWTGLSFLVGAVAITGLPPLNGFISEFLIFRAGLAGAILPLRTVTITASLVIGGLALIGGLAAACFAKSFGIIFLGEPRGAVYADIHDPGPAMRLPLLVLAGLCLALGLSAPWLLSFLGPVISTITGFDPKVVREPLAATSAILVYVSATSAVVLALSAGFFLLRRRLLARRRVGLAVTWDCGYAAPSPRMQYTGSSFVRPLTALFQPLLAGRTQFSAPDEIFPRRGTGLVTHVPDLFRNYLYDPLFRGISRVAGQFQRLQHGNIHLYVLYIAATLFVLLIWKLGVGL